MGKERSPRHSRSQEGLAEAHAADLPNQAATLQKGKEGIQQKQDSGGQYGHDPRTVPGHRSRCVGLPREEKDADRKEGNAQDNRGHQIPAERFLKNRSQPGLGGRVAFDTSVGMKRQMRAFVRGHLQDYKGEAQLEDDLQRHQAEQRVVVALLDRRKKPKDQQHRASAAQNLNAARQNCERNRAIKPQNMLQPLDPLRPARRSQLVQVDGNFFTACRHHARSTLALLFRCNQFQDELTIFVIVCEDFQFKTSPARDASATSTGGSPGLRGAIFVRIFVPVAAPIAVTNSLIDLPSPVPRFIAVVEPPSARYSNASTWASAKSLTWM